MKTMIKSMALVAIMAIFAFSVSAQDTKQKRTPEERAAKQTEMMTKSLELNQDQQAKVKEINLKYAKKMDEARAAAKEDRAQMKQTAESNMTAKDAELKKVLTSEQYQKWIEVKKEAREKMKDRAGKGNKSSKQ